MKHFVLFFFLLLSAATTVPAADRYVTPYGGGLKNGASYADAFDASHGGLQACWDSIGPGDACRVGADHYSEVTLKISSGGNLKGPKTLAGQMTPFEKRPVFTGGWKKEVADKGPSFIALEPGSDDVLILGLSISHYQYAIRTLKAGRVDRLRIRDIDIGDTRIGIELYGDENCSGGPAGGDKCPRPENASHDIEIADVNIKGATKGGIRLRFGVYGALIKNCHVDMGGREYDTDPGGDMVAFSLGDGGDVHSDSPDRDITYIACTARNAYDDSGQDKYWQGDGFKSENFSTGVRYIRCGAFDNTDGGFDVKGPGTKLLGCVAARNKRNFRLWNVNKNEAGRAVLTNCLGHHAKYWGGGASVANLHLFGDALITNSTFHNTMGLPPGTKSFIIHQETNHYKEGFATELRDVIYSCDARSSPGTVLKHAESDKKTRSYFSETGTAAWDGEGPELSGQDPLYVNSRPGFEGGATNLDNRRYGRAKGYFFADDPSK